MSDFLFVPAAGFGEESFRDEGLELFPASLADDLVPAILRRGYSDRKVTGRYKSENPLFLDESGRIGDQPRICIPETLPHYVIIPGTAEAQTRPPSPRQMSAGQITFPLTSFTSLSGPLLLVAADSISEPSKVCSRTIPVPEIVCLKTSTIRF